jgi:hypothetical protein
MQHLDAEKIIGRLVDLQTARIIAIMKYIAPLLFLIAVAGCQNKKTHRIKNTAAAALPATKTTLNYDSCKKQISRIKQKNRQQWARLSSAHKQKIVTAAVAETIIPNWIGTKWDFNGTTQTPQKGSIACGYFVTTVLQDAGFTLARTRLAQCASEQMITALVQPKYIQRFSNVSIENFISTITSNNYGLYIVGLDNHTGFIYNDGKEIYFIHSTYVGTRNVQKELAASSWVLKQSRYKVLAKLSADEKLLNKWIE